jgi:hypothetical protein
MENHPGKQCYHKGGMGLLGAFVLRRSWKRNLTMSSKHGVWTGTFELRIKAYTTRGVYDRDEGCCWSDATRKGASAQSRKKRTDLKGKRLSSPHRFFYKSIVNVKGITVISHRLCPVHINRWTVPQYCTHWLVLACVSHLYFYLLSSRRYTCNPILFLLFHNNEVEMNW